MKAICMSGSIVAAIVLCACAAPAAPGVDRSATQIAHDFFAGDFANATDVEIRLFEEGAWTRTSGLRLGEIVKGCAQEKVDEVSAVTPSDAMPTVTIVWNCATDAPFVRPQTDVLIKGGKVNAVMIAPEADDVASDTENVVG